MAELTRETDTMYHITAVAVVLKYFKDLTYFEISLNITLTYHHFKIVEDIRPAAYACNLTYQ